MPREQATELSIDHVQVLAPDGSADPDLDPDLPEERLLELYRSMRYARRLDERAVALQRRGELGTYAPATGQEAAQVGSATALADDDWMVTSFREQPAYLARDTPAHLPLWYAMGMEEGTATPPPTAVTCPPRCRWGRRHSTGRGSGEPRR